MADSGHVYGKVKSKTGLQNVFVDIRHDVADAKWGRER